MNPEYDKGYQSGYDAGYKRARIDYGLESDPCPDCVRREEVHDLLATWLSDYLTDETRDALETIDGKVADLPSVTPSKPVEGLIKEILDKDDAIRDACGYGLEAINVVEIIKEYCGVTE